MIKRLTLTLLLVLSGFVAGLVVTGRMRSADEALADPERTPAAAASVPVAAQAAGAPAAPLPDFAEVAERTVPAVVNISAIQVVRTPNPFFTDPFFRRFFGDDDMFGYTERRGESAGSGVIVSPDGYILTNNHVVPRETQQITVILSDRRERPARIVGSDPMTDLALLKIDANRLPTIPWGDSSRLRVAEWVLAIGNPYQLSSSVSLGIVSATNRTAAQVAALVDFIQTDAAINPGNSGGALINRSGELVGINTFIYSESGGYQGIGFAVPSNLARRILEDLRKYGEVRRGSIGRVRPVSLTPELAQELGARDTRGALIWEMSRSSPAWEAGMRPGDIVIAFNGRPVEDATAFVRLLSEAKIGSTVSLELEREGRRFEIRVPVMQDRSTGARPRRTV